MSRITIDKEYGVKLMPPHEDGTQSLGLRVHVEGRPYFVSVQHDRTFTPLFPTMENGGVTPLFLTPEEKQELLQFADETEPTNHAVYQFQQDMIRNIENTKTENELRLLISYKLLDKPKWNNETKTYQAVVEINRGDKFLISVKANLDGKAKMKVFSIIEPFDEEDEMEAFVDDEPFDLNEKIKALIWNDIKDDIAKDMKNRLINVIFED